MNAWECDTVGHFTIACYVDRLADAIIGFLAAADLGMEYMRRERRALATVDLHARFASELHAGDVIHAESGAIAGDERGLASGHRLVDSAAGTTSATFEIRQRFMDLDARRGLEFDAALRRRAGALAVAWDAPARPAPADRPSPAGDEGLRDTLHDSVKPWEIDVLEHLSLPFYVHRCSAATLQMAARAGMTPAYMREAGVGFSTFELLARFRREFGAGDRIRGRSAFLHVGSSSLRVVTRLYHAGTGEIGAEFSQFGVQLDLATRRPRPLPDAIRARARELLVSGESP